MKVLTIVLVATSTWLFAAGAARARSASYYGDAAAMTGASGMALYHGGGAVWYNPAGIAGSERNQIDLSASAFVLRLRNSSGLLTTEIPGATHVADLAAVSIQTVPSAVVFKRRLYKKLHGALVILVSDMESYHLEDDMMARGGAYTYYQRTSIDQILQTYHLGFTLGWEVSERFRIGWSAYAVYSRFSYEVRATTEAHTSVDPSTGVATSPYLLVDNSAAESSLWGIQLGMGLQWQLAERWHLGLMVRAPVIEIQEKSTALRVLTSAMQPEHGVGTGLYVNRPLARRVADLVSPMQVVLCLAFKQPRYWIGLEGDVTLPVKNFQEWLDYPAQWNLRFGGHFLVGKRAALGFGLFTERSLRREPVADFPGDAVFDYYGATFGVSWRTTYKLAKPLRADGLVLTTTIGLRYAFGTGSMTTVRNNLVDLENAITTFGQQHRNVHELGLYIGSSLYF
jgi:hypothetical protein